MYGFSQAAAAEAIVEFDAGDMQSDCDSDDDATGDSAIIPHVKVSRRSLNAKH
jgi:hypothetical protein